MMQALKSEYRKLFTVRSTYVIVGLITLFMVIFAFYAQGVKAEYAVEYALTTHVSSAIINGTNIVGVFAALIGLLLFTHEYRYNTIVYTLAASNSRLKPLAAKFIAGSSVAIVLTLAFGMLIPVFIYLGTRVAGLELAAQDVPYLSLLWKCLLVSWANMMYALLIASLIRNQVGVVAAYFLIPSTVEGLLSIVLKDNTVYLPFSVLSEITSRSPTLSAGVAAAVVMAYVVAGSVAAAYLFFRRDAN